MTRHRGTANKTPGVFGFTLIEMAIVLVIVGLLAGLVLPVVGDLIKREKRSATGSFLEKAKNEIIGFALINKRLPNALDGTDLGFRISEDPYGNDVQYVVDSALSSSDLCSASPADDITLTLTDTTGDTDYTQLGFVIYTAGRDRNIETDVTANVVHVYDSRAWVSGVTGYDDNEFDDQYEYVSFTFLRNKICTNTASDSFTPAGSDVSFSQDINDFSGDDTGVSPYGSGGGAITVNTETNSVELGGGDDATAEDGCIWYQGNDATGNCGTSGGYDPGVCEWQDGIRTYFSFVARQDTTDSDRGWGGGFTFALVDGANEADSCGAVPTNGAYLAYNGDTGAPSETNLVPPKLAMEFDFARDGTKQDPAYNHVSWIYWSQDTGSGGDDNEHSVTVLQPTPDSTASPLQTIPDDTSIATPPPLYGEGPGDPTWMEDAIEKRVRIEITRDRNAGDDGYDFNLKAWIDCDDGNCSDLTGTMFALSPLVDPTIEHDFTIKDDDIADWGTMRFGWTVGTGGGYDGATDVLLTDFGIKFLP